MAQLPSVPSVAKLVLVCAFVALLEFASSTVQNNGSLQYHYVCPGKFENVGRKCYHFSNTTKTWFQAYFSCKDLAESNLTINTDRYDQRQLEQYLFKNKNPRPQNSTAFWIGGFKDWKQKKWIYTDGSLMQYPTSKEIHLSDQDNWTCLLVDLIKKRWRADNCMERRPFICEKAPIASVLLSVTDKKVKRRITIDECVSNHYELTKKQRRRCLRLLNGNRNRQDFNNEPAAVIQPAKPAYSPQPTVIKAVSHICPQNWMALGNQCYLFSKEKATWSDAHFNCRQINAKLAIVRTRAQDQKLRIFLNGFTEKSERWIGGRYNTKINQWIWALSGKPLKYNGFVQQPSFNSSAVLEWQAVVMDPQYSYQWTHRNELERHLYICQVKGTPVKRLNYPRRPSATIQIIQDKGYPTRKQYENRLRNQNGRRGDRNKRS